MVGPNTFVGGGPVVVTKSLIRTRNNARLASLEEEEEGQEKKLRCLSASFVL